MKWRFNSAWYSKMNYILDQVLTKTAYSDAKNSFNTNSGQVVKTARKTGN